jgi:hypothetical protein
MPLVTRRKVRPDSGPGGYAARCMPWNPLLSHSGTSGTSGITRPRHRTEERTNNRPIRLEPAQSGPTGLTGPTLTPRFGAGPMIDAVPTPVSGHVPLALPSGLVPFCPAPASSRGSRLAGEWGVSPKSWGNPLVRTGIYAEAPTTQPPTTDRESQYNQRSHETW